MRAEHVSIEQLALYWSGDLDSGLRDMEEHLAHCAACRAALEEFNQAQELLARCSPEPTEEDRLALHESVLSRIQNQPRRPNAWIWGIAAATAALAISLFRVLTPHPLRRADVPQSSFVALPERMPLTLPLPARVAVPHRTMQPGLRSVALITRADGPPIVKMKTSDPNVVILLQVGNAQPQERTEINE